jgi:hypothetical protein
MFVAEDQRVGTWLLFHEDGRLVSAGPYGGDNKISEWRDLWPDGKLWRKPVYDNGIEDTAAARHCAEVGGAWVANVEKRALGCQVCRALPDDSIEPVKDFYERQGKLRLLACDQDKQVIFERMLSLLGFQG